MKKLIKLAAVIAAMGLALSFVACDDDDDDDDNTTTETEEGDIYDADSDSSLTLMESGDYVGYYSLDVSSLTLSSSSVTQLLTADQLTGASEVVFVVTYDSSTSWITIYSDTSWSNDQPLGTYGATGTSTATLSDLTSYTDGIYIAGSDGTLDGVYIKY